jgi:AraC family transcriptional regulator, transcriptional activator of pobA
MQKSHQREKTIPLNDLSAFYRQFSKREKMTAADMKQFLSQIPSDNYFRIARTEDAIRVLGLSLPPNRYKFYYISLVTKGYAIKTIGLHTFRIKSNTLWFVPPGLIHSSKDWSHDARGYYITFSPDYLLFDASYQMPLQQSPFFKLNCAPYLYLNKTDSEEIVELFKKMYREAERRDAFKDALIRLYIRELLMKAERMHQFQQADCPAQTRTSLGLVNRFIQSVEAHFIEQKSVGFYANLLAIHPNYLNSVVKTVIGNTARNIILERTLLEAKCLLYQSQLSVKEIAAHLRFQDASYFSRFFKKHTRSTPQEYQKRVHL